MRGGAMTSLDSSQRAEAEQWFLDRGLPSVLRPGAVVRRVWSRSAPALAAFGVMMAFSIIVVLITGQHTIDIDGRPTRTEWFVLGSAVLVLPSAALAGWLVSRIRSDRNRALASTVSVAIAFLGAAFGGPSSRIVVNLLFTAIVIAVVLVLTATGVGAILGWAVHTTASHVALMGTLIGRALPVVLLTVLVFFNSYVWLMAATVSRVRLWLAIGFLTAIAVAFMVSSTVERVRPMLTVTGQLAADDQRLADTPFAAVPERPARRGLSRGERWNVAFVLTVSQSVQVGIVAAITAGIFFVLGLILLSPQLLAEWTRSGSSDGQILGMTFPVPNALIQISMFLGALTFMYVSARAAGDADYRKRFLDPLIADLQLTLLARNRYRTLTAR